MVIPLYIKKHKNPTELSLFVFVVGDVVVLVVDVDVDVDDVVLLLCGLVHQGRVVGMSGDSVVNVIPPLNKTIGMRENTLFKQFFDSVS